MTDTTIPEQRSNQAVSPAAQRHRRVVGVRDLGCDRRNESVAAERRAADEQQRRADVVFQPAALVPAVGVWKVPELPEPQEPQLSLLPDVVSHWRQTARLWHMCLWFRSKLRFLQPETAPVFLCINIFNFHIKCKFKAERGLLEECFMTKNWSMTSQPDILPCAIGKESLNSSTTISMCFMMILMTTVSRENSQ